MKNVTKLNNFEVIIDTVTHQVYVMCSYCSIHEPDRDYKSTIQLTRSDVDLEGLITNYCELLSDALGIEVTMYNLQRLLYQNTDQTLDGFCERFVLILVNSPIFLTVEILDKDGNYMLPLEQLAMIEQTGIEIKNAIQTKINQ